MTRLSTAAGADTDEGSQRLEIDMMNQSDTNPQPTTYAFIQTELVRKHSSALKIMSSRITLDSTDIRTYQRATSDINFQHW